MNKLDEVKEKIHQIHLHEFNVVEKYYAVLETLRPYVELSELILKNKNPECDEILFEKKQTLKEYMKIYNKIKEQGQK